VFAAWGDSLTAGAGSTPYTATLGILRNAEVFNMGVSGETSTQIKTRMVADTPKLPLYVLIWAGRNNTADPTTIKADIASMVAALGHTHYLVLSILNQDVASEWSGGATYTTITTLNNDLAALYPNNYLDVRAVLVAAYAPGNAQDVIDHGHDVSPSSLRSDGLHLNTAGYTIVANAVNTYITAHP
jgi:lysophospholipase L1-like esterase